MRVPKEDGDSIGVEDYFGAKAADGALENLLERHSVVTCSPFLEYLVT